MSAVATLTFVPRRTITADMLMFGCAPIGNLYTRADDDDAIAALQLAFRRGVRQFDTAPLYGFGLSEVRLANALSAAEFVGEAQIITKVGRVTVPLSSVATLPAERAARIEDDDAMRAIYPSSMDNTIVIDYSAAGVREAFAGSVARLGASLRVVCLRVHDADSEERIDELLSSGGVEELVRMRDVERTIGAVSLGMNDAPRMLRLLRAYPKGTFDNVLLAGSYNLLTRVGSELLAECEARGVEVQLAGVFASGCLWGGAHFRYAPMSQHVRAAVARWQAFCDARGVSLQAAALAFAFRPRVVTHVAIGMRSESEVMQNLAVVTEASGIDESFWQAAEIAQLLANDVE
jgi:D-threo-aldose 1-dehydrogenase